MPFAVASLLRPNQLKVVCYDWLLVQPVPAGSIGGLASGAGSSIRVANDSYGVHDNDAF